MEKRKGCIILNWDKSVWALPQTTGSYRAGHSPQGRILWSSCWQPVLGIGVEGSPAEQWGTAWRDALVILATGWVWDETLVGSHWSSHEWEAKKKRNVLRKWATGRLCSDKARVFLSLFFPWIPTRLKSQDWAWQNQSWTKSCLGVLLQFQWVWAQHQYIMANGFFHMTRRGAPRCPFLSELLVRWLHLLFLTFSGHFVWVTPSTVEAARGLQAWALAQLCH